MKPRFYMFQIYAFGGGRVYEYADGKNYSEERPVYNPKLYLVIRLEYLSSG